MPESCHYLTALPALSHPCLVSLLFIPSLYSTFFNSKNFLFTCLLPFFYCTTVLRSYIQKCIRFCGKRTWHKQVIDINNFLLPEAVCCCLQTCNFCFNETLSQYVSVPSFVTKGHSIVKL